jgi:AcrR family transcriptional regulator
MARWEPGAAGRLREAALELFARQGFDQTTAAEIAAAAGLTRRTFFRHFPDKRDVLFAGEAALERALVSAVDEAPEGLSPLSLIGLALDRASDVFVDMPRDRVRARQAIIDSDASLLERQREKYAALARTMGAALGHRGISEPAATLAAECASVVFTVALTQWLADGESRALSVIAADVLAELRALDVPR